MSKILNVGKLQATWEEEQETVMRGLLTYVAWKDSSSPHPGDAGE